MKYAIDTSIDDDTFINWERIFEALNTRQFNTFTKDIEFPFLVTDDVNTLSKNFVLTFLQYLGRTTPESPSPEFLETLQQDDPLLEMWNIAINHLQNLGHADAFYSWGKQSFFSQVPDYNPFEIISDWTGLLVDWTLDPTNEFFPPLKLPQKTILT